MKMWNFTIKQRRFLPVTQHLSKRHLLEGQVLWMWLYACESVKGWLDKFSFCTVLIWLSDWYLKGAIHPKIQCPLWHNPLMTTSRTETLAAVVFCFIFKSIFNHKSDILFSRNTYFKHTVTQIYSNKLPSTTKILSVSHWAAQLEKFEIKGNQIYPVGLQQPSQQIPQTLFSNASTFLTKVCADKFVVREVVALFHSSVGSILKLWDILFDS